MQVDISCVFFVFVLGGEGVCTQITIQLYFFFCGLACFGHQWSCYMGPLPVLITDTKYAFGLPPSFYHHLNWISESVHAEAHQQQNVVLNACYEYMTEKHCSVRHVPNNGNAAFQHYTSEFCGANNCMLNLMWICDPFLTWFCQYNCQYDMHLNWPVTPCFRHFLQL